MQPSAYTGIEGVTKGPRFPAEYMRGNPRKPLTYWVHGGNPPIPLTYDWSDGQGERASPCPLRAESNRCSPPGRRQNGPLQLPLRPAAGWEVLAADRGHRSGPLQAGEPGTDPRGPA